MAKRRTPNAVKTEQAKQVKIWLEPGTLELIDDYAKRHKRSRSFVIDHACEKYLGGLDAKRKTKD